ncbi:hypothetical protein VTL71DRAFT_6866 [Oculimacula yallundae]|uniref:Uncharacterized protein n=1 Tax=Oculimacula yallundae TaxID=86028 RepID=A0ABR4BWN4_9HELO
MSRFEGKVAFVTGGASGMGLAIVKRLAEEGAKVVMADIQWELVQKNAKEIGNSVAPFRLDQSDPKSVEAAINFAEEKFGGLDFAVNAAAIQGSLGPIEALEVAEMQSVINVNLLGIAYCLKYELLALQKRKGGAIVNIASTCGMRPTANLAIYSASKAGVLSLTTTSATESGPHGIRVNTLSPGYVDTPLLDQRIDRAWAASITPNRRCGKTDDIADVTLFLLSDAARQVNGINVPVDGGLVASFGVIAPGFGTKTTL